MCITRLETSFPFSLTLPLNLYLIPLYIYLCVVIFCLQQTAIVNQARSFIETKQIVCAGPFVYTCLDEVKQLTSTTSVTYM